MRLVFILFLMSVAIATLTRFILLGTAAGGVDWQLNSLLELFARGFVFDVTTGLYLLLPLVLFLLLIPARWHTSKLIRYSLYLGVFGFIYILLFVAVAEWFFWDEFGTRFNFIAVDYLVYRREVAENIQQSYPVGLIFSILAIIALAICYKLKAAIDRALEAVKPFHSRLLISVLLCAVSGVLFVSVNGAQKQFSTNRYQNELAGNGIYDFFYAFRHNQLPYRQFYVMRDDKRMSALLRREVKQKDAQYLNQALFNLGRRIRQSGPERRLNIFLVVMESQSAKYFKMFGREDDSSHLEKFARQGLNFTNVYATGTRTVRGLESISLSFPPTPGRSIVKRPNNGGLFSITSVLNAKGYTSTFLYGGLGYFDNMNAFFSGNGFNIVDRDKLASDEKTFANAWGVADEDVYRRALREADKAYKNKQPFFSLIMTTSNHRPYTYPKDRIDIPSGTSHEGAAKYADWAVGEFVKNARKKPWFDDTVFVFVADHCSGCAGKTALPLARYHVPFIVYAPKYIRPRKVSKLASQIDVAPTLLALLNMQYDSYFFGKNILTMQPKDERALISNYQRLGVYRNNKLTVLMPQQKAYQRVMPLTKNRYQVLKGNDPQLDGVIDYYQGADFIYQNRTGS